MALIPKPDVTIRWAEGGNQLEPASEVKELGFVVEKPPYEVVNWLHNKHDTAVAYLYQEGFADWDIETEYSNTSYVKYNGIVYKALLQNIGKQPDINPDTWIIAFANYQNLVDLSQDLQNTKNVAGHANNLVYKDSPVMTGKAIGTSFSANSGIGTNDGYQFNNHSRDGLFHNGTNPVVLNDGATVASFTGNTSSPAPKDVVTFDMLQKYLELYKVGDLYITTDTSNPATRLGYGTWERYAEGRALVGFNSDVTSSAPDWVKQIGNTYGSYTHQLTEEELPKIDARLKLTTWVHGDDASGSGAILTANRNWATGTQYPEGATVGINGQDKPHNNVQPSIVVFVWRRTA